MIPAWSLSKTSLADIYVYVCIDIYLHMIPAWFLTYSKV